MKNLSALLLDASGEMIAWGYDARRMWLTQGMALRYRRGSSYYHGFKMDLLVLRNKGKSSGGQSVKSQSTTDLRTRTSLDNDLLGVKPSRRPF